MNKKIKLVVSILVLLAIIGINISYAINIPSTLSFIEINKTEVSKGETLEVTIDLSSINLTQFEIVLNSNIEINEIYTDENQTLNEEDIEFDEDSNQMVININKETLDLNKMVLYYEIPEDLETQKILLNAQLINTEEIEKEVIDEKQIEIIVIEQNIDDEEIKQPEDDNTSEDKKGDNTNTDGNTINKGEQENINNDKINNDLLGNDNKNSIQQSNVNKTEISTSSFQTISNKTSTSQSETVTYNGSNNNYLSTLEIEGVELSTEFNKEKTTYFASVENTTSITVNATAEDSSSKVVIAGTELNNGENKILISVTAENGNVRYYRIYVTNN